MGPGELRETAAGAAETGGRIVRAGTDRRSAAEDKGLPGDYVTEVDLASERAIREVLEGATPGVPVIGEEGGGEEWLISGDILAGSPAVHAALRDIAAGSLP